MKISRVYLTKSHFVYSNVYNLNSLAWVWRSAGWRAFDEMTNRGRCERGRDRSIDVGSAFAASNTLS
jgi:hypothetical protein